MSAENTEVPSAKPENSAESKPDQSAVNGGQGANNQNRPHSQNAKPRTWKNKNFGNAKFENKNPRRAQTTNDRQDGVNRAAERNLFEKLNHIGGSTFDLPPQDQTEKKFSGRSRLYIGNLPNNISDDEVNNLFKQYGETNELFINKEKNFGFIRMDYHFNAEKAKDELNGFAIRGRNLKVRFAPNGSVLKVKNLDEYVTNELLYAAFSVFGEVDRAVVVVDDRGKPTGEGLVEFSRKSGAAFAQRKCTDGCYFITASLKPIIVDTYEILDEVDGFPERNIIKKSQDYYSARNTGPRFAPPESFEHEYGMRWKQLFDLYKQKEAALKKEMEHDMNKLVAQMEYARYEHETAMLREQLRVREMDMTRQKREWEMKERQAEESRQRTEETMRRQEEQMQTFMVHQEEEMRRRHQENTLFLQAHQLDNMLDQAEQSYEQTEPGSYSNELKVAAPIASNNLDFKPANAKHAESNDLIVTEIYENTALAKHYNASIDGPSEAENVDSTPIEEADRDTICIENNAKESNESVVKLNSWGLPVTGDLEEISWDLEVEGAVGETVEVPFDKRNEASIDAPSEAENVDDDAICFESNSEEPNEPVVKLNSWGLPVTGDFEEIPWDLEVEGAVGETVEVAFAKHNEASIDAPSEAENVDDDAICIESNSKEPNKPVVKLNSWGLPVTGDLEEISWDLEVEGAVGETIEVAFAKHNEASFDVPSEAENVDNDAICIESNSKEPNKPVVKLNSWGLPVTGDFEEIPWDLDVEGAVGGIAELNIDDVVEAENSQASN